MLLYRTVRSAEEWRELMTDRVLSGWSHDPDGDRPATEAEADDAGDDVYTSSGWNVEPREYPTLAHIARKG